MLVRDFPAELERIDREIEHELRRWFLAPATIAGGSSQWVLVRQADKTARNGNSQQ